MTENQAAPGGKNIGLIQVYTGDGKGKSTAAFGLALRAAGAGLKTVIIQFMKKGEWYSEIGPLAELPGVSVFSYGSDKFLRKGQEPAAEHLEFAAQAYEHARQIIAENSADMLILDELNNALYFDLLSEAQALELIARKPAAMELVLTGRNAPQDIIDVADLVTEMREIKHPYQKGIVARKGIEY